MATRTIYLEKDNAKWLKEQEYTNNVSGLFNRLLRNFIKHYEQIQEIEALAARDAYDEISNSTQPEDDEL